METSAKILVTGGVFAIAIALVLGFRLSQLRRKAPLAQVAPWLTAHETTLMQGFMLLGLSVAMVASDLGAGLENAAAALIVGGATFSLLGTVSNATMKVGDQFAQRSLGLQFNTIQAVLLTPGVGILLYGVLHGL